MWWQAVFIQDQNFQRTHGDRSDTATDCEQVGLKVHPAHSHAYWKRGKLWGTPPMFGEEQKKGAAIKEDNQDSIPGSPSCLQVKTSLDLPRRSLFRMVKWHTASHPYLTLSISGYLIKKEPIPFHMEGVSIEIGMGIFLLNYHQGRSKKQLTFWKKSSPLLPFPSAAAVNKNVYI